MCKHDCLKQCVNGSFWLLDKSSILLFEMIVYFLFIYVLIVCLLVSVNLFVYFLVDSID